MNFLPRSFLIRIASYQDGYLISGGFVGSPRPWPGVKCPTVTRWKEVLAERVGFQHGLSNINRAYKKLAVRDFNFYPMPDFQGNGLNLSIEGWQHETLADGFIVHSA
jgi:hypothetical protein